MIRFLRLAYSDSAVGKMPCLTVLSPVCASQQCLDAVGLCAVERCRHTSIHGVARGASLAVNEQQHIGRLTILFQHQRRLACGCHKLPLARFWQFHFKAALVQSAAIQIPNRARVFHLIQRLSVLPQLPGLNSHGALVLRGARAHERSAHRQQRQYCIKLPVSHLFVFFRTLQR